MLSLVGRSRFPRLIARTAYPLLLLQTLPASSFSFSIPSTTEHTTSIMATTTTTASTTTPQLPWRYDDNNNNNNSGTAASLDLSDLATIVHTSHTTREAAYESSRAMRARLIAIRATAIGTPQAAADLQTFITTYNLTLQVRREANLSSVVEEYIRLCAYQHFLTHNGTLFPPPSWATDDEYMAGAMMGLPKELESYGLGRATVRDGASVQMARDITAELLEQLLQFDFRNGPLRRKYDGVKYALKSLETLLYELSVTSSTSTAEPATKKLKAASEATTTTSRLLIDTEKLTAIRERMEQRDALREQLIKHCRDGQKAAKQAIFALHRGDDGKALLKTCRTCLTDVLYPIVQQEPPLRNSGSFCGVVEEYVEACLFAAWLYGRAGVENATTTDSSTSPMDTTNSNEGRPPAVLLGWKEFETMLGFPLEPEEYLGGLSDLSGEIGRFAVQRGTARDVSGVKLCLATNAAILQQFQMMGRLPGKNGGNKMEAVRKSVSKLERMLYELSLSEAAGGRNVQTDVAMKEEEKE